MPGFRHIETNGIRLRCVVEGSGPLVVLLHGFPQCWYLWRNQIGPLVQAGYQVAAPDQRGYGGSDRPEPVEAYNIIELTNDVAGLVEALGHRKATIIGHDWGAPVAYHVALLHPDITSAVAGMSVPYSRGRIGALTRQENFGDRFWYIVYFQRPGVAEAELAADLRRSLLTIYHTVSADGANPERPAKPASAKFLDGLEAPEQLPAWLTEEDLDYYVSQFANSGFRGPLNWYRNIDRNIELTPQLEDARIERPALFLAGKEDPILRFGGGAWLRGMDGRFTDLRDKRFVEAAGHWVQLEKPAETTRALLGFLEGVV
ncbi:MAG: alpha/beta hydrolase [bacterium]|nr:alpha/beta hydrolase [bacterium]